MSAGIPFIDNALAPPEGEFAAIIGANPSRGARSPLLWNAVYETLGRACRMLPFDVSGEGLPALLAWLDEQPGFVGGAVAVPHKQAVAQWLGAARLDPSAQGILAVNALSRGAEGRLCGANTDGLAAAQVLQDAGLAPTDTVLVFGFGGAARAVVNAVRAHVARVIVVTRSAADPEAIALATWMGVELRAPEAAAGALERASVLVNGTVLGSAPDHLGASPLPAGFQDEAHRLRLAFDVVYQPADTAFLRAMPDHVVCRGGADMNRLQAVRGFGRAHPDVAEALIAATMARAASTNATARPA